MEEALPGWKMAPVVRALMSLRGVQVLTGMTLVAEVGDFNRFDDARSLMNFLGLTPAEVLKDRALRAQFAKFLPQLQLLASKSVDTYDVVGNEMMMADLAYYNSTDDAAKRGKTSAGDIHDDLSTRYPGRSSAKTPQPAAK